MLTTLNLSNFVLAQSLEIEFSKGLGMFTGETGAGKSLLFDALQSVTGSRADSGFIREGATKAEICATFSVPLNSPISQNIYELFSQWSINNNDGEILLRRIIEKNDSAGRSRAFINGSQVTITQLAEVGELLLDIHGQHESQLLIKPAKQREMLDEFAEANELAKEVWQAYRNWQDLADELKNAKTNQTLFEQEKEFLQIRFDDLANIKNPFDWDEINRKHNQLSHLKDLQENGSQLINLFSEDENSIDSIFNSATSIMVQMKNLDNTLDDIYQLINSAQNECREANRALKHYLEKLEDDPQSFSEIEEVVKNQLEVARKYKTHPELLEELKTQTENQLAKLNQSLDLSALEKQVETLENNYYGLAKKLSLIREKAAQSLATEVSKSLPALGMKEAKFFVALKNIAASSAGLETVEFQISGLAGNTFRPLNKVASGGELSRLALALYLAVHSSEAKVYLFDEIDAGIGGKVAEAVGKMLRQLSSINPEAQLLGVTHLPQVAVCANWQAVVEKELINNNGELIAKSNVRRLNNKEERIAEIARMLGGEEITAATKNHAQEMLEKYL